MRIRSRSASRRAIRLPDGVVLWTRLAPKPLEGGGMPTAVVERRLGGRARSRASQTIAQKGMTLARPELGHSVHVEVARSRARPRVLVSLPRRRRDQPDRPDQHGARRAGAAVDRLRFAVCGCNHYETGYFTAFRRIADEQFDFVFHTGDYIYEGRADGGRNDRVRQHNGHGDRTRSSTIATATRSTSPIAISWPRTPPRRSS